MKYPPDRIRWLLEKSKYAIRYAGKYAAPMRRLMKRLDGVVLYVAPEPDAVALLSRGKYWKYPVTLRRGRPVSCHENSARLWNRDPDRYRIVTGYALTIEPEGFGLWRQHSWVYDSKKKRLLETTVRRDMYYGFDLTSEEADRFFWMNVR